jgi:hypothetical protein
MADERISVMSWPHAVRIGFRCPVRAKVNSRGQRPRKAQSSFPTLKGSHSSHCSTQARRNSTRIRPFQGRSSLGTRFPGALPPATESIPYGDQGRTPPNMFLRRNKQVKRLPAPLPFPNGIEQLIRFLGKEEAFTSPSLRAELVRRLLHQF